MAIDIAQFQAFIDEMEALRRLAACGRMSCEQNRHDRPEIHRLLNEAKVEGGDLMDRIKALIKERDETGPNAADKANDEFARYCSTVENERNKAEAERDAARAALLRDPITPSEINLALAEGKAESMAAQGDNAWTTMTNEVARLRSALTEMTAARDELADLADDATEENAWGYKGERKHGRRIDALREVGKQVP